jgi:predicted TIM-barrel fold metal-dependent hydrolase
MDALARVVSSRPVRVDTHAHVFEQGLPLTQERRYAPAYDATLDAYLQLLDANDVGHAVLVQPSFLGTDNSYLLQALSRDRYRLRGVAVVSTDTSEDDLNHLHEQGITGVRLNLLGQPLPNLRGRPWRDLLSQLSRLGWHVELQREAIDLAPLIDALLVAGLPVVVDHYGRPNHCLGTRDPGFHELLRFSDSGRVWVKLSGAYRCTDAGSSFVPDAIEQLLIRFGAERLMWGSDWPHTQFEHVTDYRTALSTLLDLDLESTVSNTILYSTPHSFYGFEKESAGNHASDDGNSAILSAR